MKKRAIVYGKGPSMNDLLPAPDDYVIGVNDVQGFLPFVKNIYIEDPIKKGDELLQENVTIFSGAYDNLYSPRDEYACITNYKKTILSENLWHVDIHSLQLPWAKTSVVAATVIAWQVARPTEIILCGVDFIGDASHPVNSEYNIEKHKIVFKKIADQLANEGCTLYVISPESRLADVLPVYGMINND